MLKGKASDLVACSRQSSRYRSYENLQGGRVSGSMRVRLACQARVRTGGADVCRQGRLQQQQGSKPPTLPAQRRRCQQGRSLPTSGPTAPGPGARLRQRAQCGMNACCTVAALRPSKRTCAASHHGWHPASLLRMRVIRRAGNNSPHARTHTRTHTYTQLTALLARCAGPPALGQRGSHTVDHDGACASDEAL